MKKTILLLFLPLFGFGQISVFELSANYLSSFSSISKDRTSLNISAGYKKDFVTIGIFSGVEVEKNGLIPIGCFIEKEFGFSKNKTFVFSKYAYQIELNSGFDRQLDVGFGVRLKNNFSFKTTFLKRNHGSFIGFGIGIIL